MVLISAPGHFRHHCNKEDQVVHRHESFPHRCGVWRSRDSKLGEVPGFQEFKMLRGGELEGGGTLFISHSVWESHEAFKNWTESDAFKAAHGKSRAPEGTYLGHPEFEGFEVVIS